MLAAAIAAGSALPVCTRRAAYAPPVIATMASIDVMVNTPTRRCARFLAGAGDRLRCSDNAVLPSARRRPGEAPGAQTAAVRAASQRRAGCRMARHRRRLTLPEAEVRAGRFCRKSWVAHRHGRSAHHVLAIRAVTI